MMSYYIASITDIIETTDFHHLLLTSDINTDFIRSKKHVITNFIDDMSLLKMWDMFEIDRMNCIHCYIWYMSLALYTP